MIRSWWYRCSSREKWALGLLGSFLGILLFVKGLYEPMHDARERLEVENRTAAHLLVRLAHHRIDGSTATMSRQKVSAVGLLALLSREVRQGDLGRFPADVEQTQEGEVKLRFQKVSYALWIHWLWAFTHHYEVLIKQVHLQRAKVSGMVEVELLLAIPH
ncbi:MAG: type II secretion system protein GspM [Legionellaceae bacterium]|nr:type II secretion system protein GspM [Legionellaceae bacterium]